MLHSAVSRWHSTSYLYFDSQQGPGYVSLPVQPHLLSTCLMYVSQNARDCVWVLE
eukprot:m.442256 g.442256  ORF g.442256 m.442256 type:complete len:55 (-) comp18775_c0_seq1:107-271(-)